MAERRIAVAMSGGVDSSVAAALLANQGDEVFGIMLRLWNDVGLRNRCCSPEDMGRARQVASAIGIPFYVLDAREVFKQRVVDYFVDGYSQGITPNPCIECNRKIRWDYLLKHVIAMGATYMATGHYARLDKFKDGFRIARSVDLKKDQSYVLSILTQEQLAHTLLPLGTYRKSQVRELAHRYDLPVADRPDSQDLCFLGPDDYRQFLSRHVPSIVEPGQIVNSDGKVIGVHNGLFGYTIGQRKGIGLSMPSPHYVISKEAASNTLVVGPHESLGRSSFSVKRVNWIAGKTPSTPVKVMVQIRYKAKEVPAVVTPEEDNFAKVLLDKPLPDITPGQLAVFYDDDICLGGGTISQ
jgi:tRNA-specific 2-thiouridylase